MASEKDLFNAVKESLEKDGRLSSIKAEVRQEVMKILGINRQLVLNTQLPKEIEILNEMVREYLNWAGYQYTSNVFSSESSLKVDPMKREEMLKGLNIEEGFNCNSLTKKYLPDGLRNKPMLVLCHRCFYTDV